jgi:hypothetical protein
MRFVARILKPERSARPPSWLLPSLARGGLSCRSDRRVLSGGRPILVRMDETKTCTKCGKVLPATTEFFSPYSRSDRRLHSYCRGCARAYARRWRAEGPPRRPERPTQKPCVKCGRVLSNTAQFFAPYPGQESWLRHECRDCCRQDNRERAKARQARSGIVPRNTTKRCSRCGQAFPATTEFFYRDNGPNGLKSCCKHCIEAAKRARRVERKLRYEAEHPKDPSIKVCSKCGMVVPAGAAADFFPKYPRAKDGLRTYCKDCQNEYVRKWKTEHRRA